MKVIFYREHKKYYLFKDGIEYIIRAHHMKNEGSIVNIGHLKMIVNASSKLTLMSTVASEDQVQVKSNLQLVMVKEDLKGSFSNLYKRSKMLILFPFHQLFQFCSFYFY